MAQAHRDPTATSGRSGDRLTAQTRALLDLARSPVLHAGDETAYRAITEAAAQALGVERVGVWLYDADRTCIRCADLFVYGTAEHVQGAELFEADFPKYFAALEEERTINASDALRDPRTREFVEPYLLPLGIGSLLDAPIRLGGRMRGVVCHEHVGPRRDWTEADRAFAGSVADFVALAIESAERRQAERSLRESDERMRGLLDSTAEAIYGVDLDGACTFCNASCLRLLGYEDEAQLLGRNVLELVHRSPTQSSRAGEPIRHAFRGAEPLHVTDEVLWRADGSCFPAEYRSHPTYRDGQLVGSVVTFLDVTERRASDRAQRAVDRQLRRAQKVESLANLAGGVAHDFNNLLLAVLGNAGLALMDLPADSPARESIEQVEIAALRAAELSRQLLAYSGQGSVVAEPTDVTALVDEMVRLLRSSLPPDAKLELDLTPDLPQVLGDATQLRQVVMNLIVNAGEALERKAGTIRVRTDLRLVREGELRRGWGAAEALPPGPHVQLTVEDNGAGMDRETASKIFDPFFSTKVSGRGLGLAAVLGIVRSHEGRIDVQTAPGRGARFEVLLPAAARQAEPDAPSVEHAVPAHATGSILVADDEPAVRRVARRILESAGFDVLEAEDGEAALALVEERAGQLRLVVLDVKMPRLDGDEAGARIRAIAPQLPLLLSSGCAESTVRGNDGTMGFLAKPYRPAALLEAVRRQLTEP